MAAPESTALTIQNTMTAVLKLPTASISIRNVSSKTSIGIATTASVLPCIPRVRTVWPTPLKKSKKLYYKLHYTNFTEKQNERNAKIRHTERNRSTEDLLTSKKTCPEESIYQLGTLESHASPKELFQIATEFMDEFHERFGKHVHILDWALHLDEGTPHIHERHVFDCENKYGEIAPQQEKRWKHLALNCQSQTSPLAATTTARSRSMQPAARCCSRLPDATVWNWMKCRNTVDGHTWKKQDYIMAKQKSSLPNRKKAVQEQTVQLENLKQEHENENLLQVRRTTYQSLTIMRNDKKIQKQEKRIDELSQQIEDTENFLEEISAIAYDKAVAVVSEKSCKGCSKGKHGAGRYLFGLAKEPGRKANKETVDYTTYQIITLRKILLQR